jgi:hypothetical protein
VADPGRRLPASCPGKSGVTRFAEVSNSSKRIAAQLYLSVNSAETHLASCLPKAHTNVPMPEGSGAVDGRSRCGGHPDAGDLRI